MGIPKTCFHTWLPSLTQQLVVSHLCNVKNFVTDICDQLPYVGYVDAHKALVVTPCSLILNQIIGSYLGCLLLKFLTPSDVINFIASKRVSCPLTGIVSKHRVMSATQILWTSCGDSLWKFPLKQQQAGSPIGTSSTLALAQAGFAEGDGKVVLSVFNEAFSSTSDIYLQMDSFEVHIFMGWRRSFLSSHVRDLQSKECRTFSDVDPSDQPAFWGLGVYCNIQQLRSPKSNKHMPVSTDDDS